MSEWIGKEISHYRVLEQLGQGGMAVVYLAEDMNIGRRVVLKILKGDLTSDSRMKERFRREARACATVTHPNISTIYEVDCHGDLWYICMEYVQGQTLRAILRERSFLPVEEALRLATATADALAAAHDRGIVHRDLKPENIMVTESGQVKVLDFGLAVFTHHYLLPLERAGAETDVNRLTTQGVAIGTLHYMSPEQTRGQMVTPASDVFSLATVLYETLAGLPPFRGENSLAVMHAIAYDDPPLLSKRRAAVPLELEQLIRIALNKDPSRRHSSCRTLHQDLQRIAATVQPLPESRVDPAVSATQTQPTVTVTTPDAEQTTDIRRTGPRLAGREQELRTLTSHLERAALGQGSLVLVAGEAGIGKTRLVEELARHAEGMGTRYLAGRCLFKEGTLPYHPFFEAADRLISSLGLDDVRLFEDYVRNRMPALAGRLPVLKSFLHVAGHESTGLIAEKEHLLDAISALFLAFARERPMILHIDDIHWADEASLDLLLFLARNCQRSKGLIIGTYRPEEVTREGGPAHPLEHLLGRMSAGDLYAEISLGRLGSEETAAIVSSALDGASLDRGFVEKLHEETAGNPFYVLETLKLLSEDGTLEMREGRWSLTREVERVAIPGRVHDVVSRRLASLSAADREILEVAAAEGMVFRSDTIVSCLELRRLKVLGALQRAEKDHRLIHAEEDRYTFDHPLIRETLYDTIIPELRREYHSLIGDFLAENRAGKRGHDASIAYQYLQAGKNEAALEYILKAGKSSRHLFANREALSWLNRAEAILSDLGETATMTAEKLRLHKERGLLLQRLGQHEPAMDDFRKMKEVATSAGMADRQAHALYLMADLFYATGDYEKALEHSGLSRDLAVEAGDTRSLSNALRVAGFVHFFRAEYDEALEAHNRSIDLQKQIDDVAGQAENLNKVGNIYLFKGEHEKAGTFYTRALVLAIQAGNRLAEAEALNNLGLVHYYGGNAQPALEHFERCLELKREIGDKRSLARSLNNLAMVMEMRGDLRSALAKHKESLALSREINDQGTILQVLCNLANDYLKLGRYGEALASCEESLATCRAIGDKLTTPYALNCLGRIRMHLNQPEVAAELFEEALAMTRDQGQRVESCESLRNLGAARMACGLPDEALTILDESLSLARELQARDQESEIVGTLGLIHASLGDAGATALSARDLGILAEKLQLPELEVRRLHLQGKAVLLSSPAGSGEAAGLLREGADLAEKVGLKELEWMIRRDLADALGDGPESQSEIDRAAAILRDIGTRAGSSEASARYMAAPGRKETLEKATQERPALDEPTDS